MLPAWRLRACRTPVREGACRRGWLGVGDEVHERFDIASARDHPCLFTLDEKVRACARHACDRSGYCSDSSAQSACFGSDPERLGTCAGLDDHGCRGESGEKTVAGQEPSPRWYCPRGLLRDHDPFVAYPVEQVGIALRIVAVDTTSQHRSSRSVPVERLPVHLGLDPVSTARHHVPPILRKFVRQLPGYVHT